MCKSVVTLYSSIFAFKNSHLTIFFQIRAISTYIFLKLEVSFITYFINNFCSDGSNYVRSSMFECSKPKIGVRVRLPKMNTFSVRSMFEALFDEHLTNIESKICKFLSLTLVTKLTASLNGTLIFIQINVIFKILGCRDPRYKHRN